VQVAVPAAVQAARQEVVGLPDWIKRLVIRRKTYIIGLSVYEFGVITERSIPIDGLLTRNNQLVT
jgi:hypothetical protein